MTCDAPQAATLRFQPLLLDTGEETETDLLLAPTQEEWANTVHWLITVNIKIKIQQQ